METFSALLALCEGSPPVTGGFPSQWPVTWGFDVLICAWTDVWANNRDTNDLRCNSAQFDVTVVELSWYYARCKLQFLSLVSFMWKSELECINEMLCFESWFQHWEAICALSMQYTSLLHQWYRSALLQVMVFRLLGTKPLTEPAPAYCQLDSGEQI